MLVGLGVEDCLAVWPGVLLHIVVPDTMCMIQEGRDSVWVQSPICQSIWLIESMLLWCNVKGIGSAKLKEAVLYESGDEKGGGGCFALHTIYVYAAMCKNQVSSGKLLQ